MTRRFHRSRDTHQKVLVSYVLAFGITAVCISTMYLSINSLLNDQRHSPALVNQSGRQRTLTQRIASISNRLLVANSTDEREDVRDELRRAKQQFTQSMDNLTRIDSKSKRARDLRKHYLDNDEVAHFARDISKRLDQLLLLPENDPQTTELVQSISSIASNDLLPELDSVAQRFVSQNENYLEQGLRWETFLFLVTLLILVIQAVYIFQPIMQANAKIEKAANCDPLTGLPNRRRLAETAKEAILRKGAKGRAIGFIHVDLDRFKAVNDTMGHGAGDALLRKVADLLKQETRTSQLVARVGGDEFAILFTDVLSANQLVGLAQRLIDRMNEPIEIDGKFCTIGCSMGIATSQPGEVDYERVLMDADIALYEAKKKGRNRYQVITEELRKQFEKREEVSEELKKGIANGEFEPYFQPQIDTVTGEVTGVEALARWIREDGVFEKNAEFIQVADEIGLLTEIDEQILHKSLGAFVEWRESGHPINNISVNLSVRELESPDLVNSITATVASFNLLPSDVSIEILESVFLDQDNTIAVSNINRLSELGFTVELDDFGTGHAAIISLLDLAVDRIKLDRSLILDIERTGPSKTITRTLIQLAHELEIETIAEGVETAGQAEQLIKLGCCNHQGFFYAKPMSKTELSEWLKARTGQRDLSSTPDS